MEVVKAQNWAVEPQEKINMNLATYVLTQY
jgi:hypothetical protein